MAARKPNVLLRNLKVQSGNLKKLSGKINQDIPKGEVGKILAEARGTFEGTRALVEKAKKDLQYMELPETFGKGRGTLTQINGLLDKLDQTSETLNRLIERIYKRPPDILYWESRRRKDGTSEMARLIFPGRADGTPLVESLE